MLTWRNSRSYNQQFSAYTKVQKWQKRPTEVSWKRFLNTRTKKKPYQDSTSTTTVQEGQADLQPQRRCRRSPKTVGLIVIITGSRVRVISQQIQIQIIQTIQTIQTSPAICNRNENYHKKPGNLETGNSLHARALSAINCHGLPWPGPVTTHPTRPPLTTPHHTAPHHTAPHHTTPLCTTTHYTTTHYTTPHHTTLHHTTSHHTTPHHTTLHYTALHYTTLH